jgi:hypothetical protein
MLMAGAVLVVLAPVALAERPPQSRDRADLVVVGKVKRITTQESGFGGDGTRTSYTAEVVIGKVERGKGAKAGDTIKVSWFHVTKRPSRALLAAYGHGYSLKEKDEARFWLMSAGKYGWTVIYNRDGVEKLGKPKK